MFLWGCSGQKPTGIWLDYNPREYIHDSIPGITSGTEGFFIDFDNNRFGMLGADSTVKVEIDYDNRILSAIYHKDLEMTFSTLNKDSVEIDMGENVMHVFRKLDISHKIKPTKERITRIIGQKCIDSVQGYKMDFTLEQYYRDKVLELPHRKNNLWNHNREDFGFWIVDKYLDNAFLMFSIGQTERKNIFQIISVSRNGIELEHLQEDGILNNLQVLNGCQ